MENLDKPVVNNVLWITINGKKLVLYSHLTFYQNDLTTVLSTEYVHVNVLYSCLLKSIEIYT